MVPGEERPTESVKHFLFKCSAHANQRQVLARKLGQGNLDLSWIMKLIKILVNFIDKTKRSKDAR